MSAATRPVFAKEEPMTSPPPIPIGAPKEAVPESALAMRMTVSDVYFFYGKAQALFHVSLNIATNRVTALIGPSGCGKSTLLRTFNRMHETMSHTRLTGQILLDGEDIFHQDVTRLRRRVGMV